MNNTYIIKNGTIVNEGKVFIGDILIIGSSIAKITEGCMADVPSDAITIDAAKSIVMPGVIDTHVHFREPGLTHKADIESESRAAAYGGVTSFFDMPNCIPQTTTLEALEEKQKLAAEKSHVNYSFFFGATTENSHLIEKLDKKTVPGVKLFMGSSTGNMLVDGGNALDEIFHESAKNGFIVMTHCEDNDIIKSQTTEAKKLYGEDADISLHPIIRNSEACKKSTLLAMTLAKKHNTQLHVAHISTKEEAELYTASAKQLGLPITFEVCLPHIIYNSEDYKTLGSRIKCNPAVKSKEDQEAIINALKSGLIETIATDHAPHTIEEKQGGSLKATSGMPMLQFSLISLFEKFVKGGDYAHHDCNKALTTIAKLVSHNPAKLFHIKERGYLKEGFKADIAIVTPCEEWTLTKENIQSKCGWSPLEGSKFHWKVTHTFCNGKHILDNGKFDIKSQGEQIEFA